MLENDLPLIDSFPKPASVLRHLGKTLSDNDNGVLPAREALLLSPPWESSHGLKGKATEWAVRQKSHRSVSESTMLPIEAVLDS